MIVGLTGGIGSGKTAASDTFASFGITVVDADVIAREVVEPGSPALAAIVENFGEELLSDDGSLDRAQLRQRIFNNDTDKQWLESLLHPLIGELTSQRLQQATSPYVIYASPLLVETEQTAMCDYVIVVDVSEAVQIERTAKRDNNSVEQVKAIMAKQASRDQRLAKADFVIDNSGSLTALQQQAAELHERLMQLACS